MWFDEDKQKLSSTVLGAGAMVQVVAGTHEGRDVSIRRLQQLHNQEAQRTLLLSSG
jgi:hypothetical protein